MLGRIGQRIQERRDISESPEQVFEHVRLGFLKHGLDIQKEKCETYTGSDWVTAIGLESGVNVSVFFDHTFRLTFSVEGDWKYSDVGWLVLGDIANAVGAEDRWAH